MCIRVVCCGHDRERERARERERKRESESVCERDILERVQKRSSGRGAGRRSWRKRVWVALCVAAVVRCNVLQCITCVAGCCSALQGVAPVAPPKVMQGVRTAQALARSVRCSVLPRVAACCCRLRSRLTKRLRAREREAKRKTASGCRGAALSVADSFHLGIL